MFGLQTPFASWRAILLVSLTVYIVSAADDSCLNCVGGGKTWCMENNQCSLLMLFCKTKITDAYNCPRSPPNGYEYSDSFARTVALPFISAAYAGDPYKCVNVPGGGPEYNVSRNQLNSTTFHKLIIVDCTFGGSASTCTAITAYDTTQNAIIVSFKGSAGSGQIAAQVFSIFQAKQPFFEYGSIYKYFYDAYMALWNGGLQAAVTELKATYPEYNLWAFGHSLGGAEASVFASYAIKNGLFNADKVRLLTFGQPRTGTKDFAKWHDDTFPYSYRVVHANDMIANLPPRSLLNGMYHHRYEVWYNNNMTQGTTFELCTLGDGNYCSNTQLGSSWDDHNNYFNVHIPTWAAQGCP